MKITILIILLSLFISREGVAQLAPNYKINAIEKSDELEGDVLIDSSPTLDIFGAGAFSAALTENNSQSNQGLGAAGLVLFNDKFQFSGTFNITNTGETEFRDAKSFGNAILIPAQGSSSVIFDYRKFNNLISDAKMNKVLGYYLNFTGVTGSQWVFQNSTISASPLSLKAQISVYPFPEAIDFGSNKILICFDFGYSGRFLASDISQESNDALRELALGTQKTSFHGIELDGHIWINDLRLFFGLPVLFGPDVPGLTGVQFIIGASLSGSALRFDQN